MMVKGVSVVSLVSDAIRPIRCDTESITLLV